MPPSMPLISTAAGSPDHVTQNKDVLSVITVKVIFDVQVQSRPPLGSRPPRIPDHLFFIRDDEGGGP